MQKDSFIGIIERYTSRVHQSFRDGRLVTCNTRDVYWIIFCDKKDIVIRKSMKGGKSELVCMMPYAHVNRCWIECRRISYLVIRTGYPMKKIYVPFPGIRQEDKEYILTSPPKKKEEWQERKKKRFALKFQNPLSEHVNKKQVIIYTDGACHQMDKTGNGIGGWAYSITVDGKEIAYGVRIENIVTNGDMEIKAAAMGLKRLFKCKPGNIIVISDYQDVNKYGNGVFKPRFDDPRKRAFEILDEAIEMTKCPVSWMWVKGHKGNRFNTLCDKRIRIVLREHLEKNKK